MKSKQRRLSGMLAVLIVILLSGVVYAGILTGGAAQTVVRAPSGNIYAWGGNYYGQLGNGTTNDSVDPVLVNGLSNVVSVSTMYDYSLALRADGTVWAWGYNGHGQLGIGNTIDQDSPVQVQDDEDPSGYLQDVVMVVTGNNHSLAVKKDGTVWAWGWKLHGRLGNGTSGDYPQKLPEQVQTQSGILEDVIKVAANGANSVALKADGTLWAWGDNRYGQVGDNTSDTDRLKAQPVVGETSGNLENIVDIAVGQFHMMALDADGTVWAWGYNAYGQLGINSTAEKHRPVQVLNLTKVKSIVTGHYHSLALKADGTVWAWGDNAYGKLGIGNTTTPQKIPVQVHDQSGDLENIVSIWGADGSHSLALKSDGTYWGWGLNDYGQLGQDPGTLSYSTVAIEMDVTLE